MSADTRIRARAILFLMRNEVEFDKDISNSMLVVLIKLFWQSVKDAKEIERQKLVAMRCFDRLTPSSWMSVNKIQVKEVMKQTSGYVVKWGIKYWVSFRPALEAISHFVFEKSGCEEGDYYLSIVDSRTHHPYRDWE